MKKYAYLSIILIVIGILVILVFHVMQLGVPLIAFGMFFGLIAFIEWHGEKGLKKDNEETDRRIREAHENSELKNFSFDFTQVSTKVLNRWPREGKEEDWPYLRRLFLASCYEKQYPGKAQRNGKIILHDPRKALEMIFEKKYANFLKEEKILADTFMLYFKSAGRDQTRLVLACNNFLTAFFDLKVKS